MVVVIIAILVVVAIPRTDVLRLLKFQGAGKKLLSDIRYAQNTAVLSRVHTGIAFLTGANQYWLYSCSNTANCFPVVLPSANWLPLKDPLSRSDMYVDYTSDTQYKNINIVSPNFNGNTMLVFNPDGTPVDTATGNALTVNSTVSLNYSGESINFNISAKTGKANVTQSF